MKFNNRDENIGITVILNNFNQQKKKKIDHSFSLIYANNFLLNSFKVIDSLIIFGNELYSAKPLKIKFFIFNVRLLRKMCSCPLILVLYWCI